MNFKKKVGIRLIGIITACTIFTVVPVVAMTSCSEQSGSSSSSEDIDKIGSKIFSEPKIKILENDHLNHIVMIYNAGGVTTEIIHIEEAWNKLGLDKIESWAQ